MSVRQVLREEDITKGLGFMSILNFLFNTVLFVTFFLKKNTPVIFPT